MSSDKLGSIYKEIPCYDNGVWGFVSYESREEFKNDLETNYFKEPGEYEFDKTTQIFQEPGNHFRKYGYYTKALEGSRDFINY